jgi:hypothetical protein
MNHYKMLKIIHAKGLIEKTTARMHFAEKVFVMVHNTTKIMIKIPNTHY